MKINSDKAILADEHLNSHINHETTKIPSQDGKYRPTRLNNIKILNKTQRLHTYIQIHLCLHILHRLPVIILRWLGTVMLVA